MKESLREEPKILAAAERQMRDWAIAREVAERVVRLHGAHAPPTEVHAFVAIARETGTGASEIARLLGESLGWQVWDQNLLDCMAQRYGHCRGMLELVDETESNWVYDVLGTWMDHKIVPHETFVAHLVPTIIAAARRGPTVFVGRGAQFVLPRHRGLAVRLVASWRYRVERVMREQNLGATAARHWIEQRDRGCREFIQRFFHHDPNDPHLYDLVLNVERYEPHGAATAILAALQARALAS